MNLPFPRLFSLLYIIGLWCLSIVCQHINAQDKVLNFTHINVNSGLSQGDVRTIYQDRNGFMWFGTWDGLNKYDGFSIKTYKEQHKNTQSIKGQLINNIVEIDEDRIAFGTLKGLNIFDGRDETFSYHSIGNKISNARIVKREEGHLILMMDDDLFFFDYNKLHFRKIQSVLSRQLEELFVKGKIGFNRSDKIITSIYEFLKIYPQHFDHLKSIMSDHTVNDILVDKRQNLFHIVSNSGYFVYTLTPFGSKILKYNGSAKCLLSENDQIFVGTENEGLLIYDSKTLKQIAHFKSIKHQTNTIGGNYIVSLLKDRENNLWCGLVGNGVSYCNLNDKKASTIFTSESLIKDQIKSSNFVALTEFGNGELWVADINGTLRVLDQSYKVINTILPSQIDKSFTNVFVQEIVESKDGSKFLLTDKGFYLIEGKTKFKKITKSNLSDNQKYGQGIIPLNETLSLLATREGMLFYDNKKHEMLDLPCPIECKTNIYNAFVGTDNLIYINPFFKGLSIYKYVNKNFELVHKINADFNIHDRCDYKDTILMATTKGILIINKRTNKFNFIDESDGLPNQNLYSVLPDHKERGSFWCSSNRGIFKYNIYTKRLDGYGLNDGLNALEFNSQAIAIRKNGDFVFGSTDGITILQPERDVLQNKNTAICLHNLKIDNGSAKNYFDTVSHSYKIPFAKNDISFSLLNLNFPNTNIPIIYRLKGYDKSLYESKNPADIRYSDLPIGVYKLEARFPGSKQELKTLATILILAPWYKKWWAYVIFLMVVVSFFGIILRFYIHNKLERQRALLENQKAIELERFRISADLHDDIGSTLSSISVYSELADKYYNSYPEKSREMIQKIASQSQSLMERMGDIIWSLKPENMEGASLKEKILSFANEILGNNNIEYFIEVDPLIDHFLQDITKRKNMLLIIKEAFHNISKYSQASRVDFTLFSEKEKEINLSILDNGVGFVPESIKKGHGLYNMKRRMSDLNGTLDIISSPGKGTLIKGRMPIARISH